MNKDFGITDTGPRTGTPCATDSVAGSRAAILTAARKLIERRENWTQSGFFQGEDRCCADAAIVLACGGRWRDVFPPNERFEEYRDAFTALEKCVGVDVWSFNDNHSHAEVLDAFDRAIFAASIEAQEPIAHGVVGEQVRDGDAQ